MKTSISVQSTTGQSLFIYYAYTVPAMNDKLSAILGGKVTPQTFTVLGVTRICNTNPNAQTADVVIVTVQ